jgi:hypothetical protein
MREALHDCPFCQCDEEDKFIKMDSTAYFFKALLEIDEYAFENRRGGVIT